MAYPILKLRWGPNFANLLDLNDNISFVAKSFDLYGGPQQDVILADTWLNNPIDVRHKLKERIFSRLVQIKYTTFSASYVDSNDELKRRLYSGKLRVVMVRAGRGYQYLECALSELAEDGTGAFVLKFTAADPVFYQCDINGIQTIITTSGSTGGPPYAVVNLPLYVGSASAEPVIELLVNGGGSVYQYSQDVTITNPSDHRYSYVPVCIDMLDLRADVTAGVFHEIGGGDLRIRDIRLETLGGARKTIFIRDIGEHGGTWHQDVKVWTILYSLAPGETKTLRLIYGCATADPAEVYNEPSTTKPMFNMYTSSNAMWEYTDFQPPWSQNQTRSMQWQAYTPGSDNITWLRFAHPAFDVPTANNVPGAGGITIQLRPSSGSAGLQLTTPPSISSIAFTYKFGSNPKRPLVLRSHRAGARVIDDWAFGPDKAALAATTTSLVTGATVLHVDQVTRGGSTFVAGDNVMVGLDDGTTFIGTIASVNAGALTITLTAGLPSASAAGNRVQQFVSGALTTINYPPGDRPRTVMFVLRGDHPELTTGGWYFGGADLVDVYFLAGEQVGVVLGTRHNLGSETIYQLRGQFGNSATAEWLRINTQTNWLDKIVIDCAARTCLYYHWNGTSFDAPVSRFERLIFETVSPTWIHVDPALSTNNVTFNDDSDSNFRNLVVTATYPVKYY